MNSKERVRAAFTGSGYDRLPMWYGAEPDTTKNVMNLLDVKTEEELMQSLGADFRTIRPRYIGPELMVYEDGKFDTIWGIKRGYGYWGIALNTPLENAENVQDVENYPFPKVEWFDVNFTKEDKKLSEKYSILGGMWSPFWHDTMELLGLEKMFIYLLDKPALVEAVLDRAFEFYYNLSVKTFDANPGLIDIFFFANDFGTQSGLFISPEMWRKFFKPRTKMLADLGHKYNLKVAMHSCGDIHQIIPDLIEIGIEILNPIQVSADNMDPVVLKREFGKDLVFFGAIDYNEILTNGSEERVREETRRMIDILGYDGKYIVAPSHDLMMAEVPAINIWAMYDEAKNYSTMRA